MSADTKDWTPTAGKNLYMDIHELGAGKVKAADVADAHKKDLATQDKRGVKFLNYWVDEASGTVICLSEAKKPEDPTKVHKEAHGLVPNSVALVSEGRLSIAPPGESSADSPGRPGGSLPVSRIQATVRASPLGERREREAELVGRAARRSAMELTVIGDRVAP